MAMTTETKPKRREGVESQPLPDGSGLLFDPVTATAYPITQSAMRIWELCDGEHSLGAMVDDLEARYEVDRATVEKDARALLVDFATRRLIEDLADAE